MKISQIHIPCRETVDTSLFSDLDGIDAFFSEKTGQLSFVATTPNGEDFEAMRDAVNIARTHNIIFEPQAFVMKLKGIGSSLAFESLEEVFHGDFFLPTPPTQESALAQLESEQETLCGVRSRRCSKGQTSNNLYGAEPRLEQLTYNRIEDPCPPAMYM